MMRPTALALVSILAGFVGPAPTRADPLPTADAYGAGKQAVSLMTGWGLGHELSGSEGDALDTRTIPVLPRWSIGITDVLGGDEPYRGNVDLAVEGVFLVNYEPHGGSAQGGSLFARYNFLVFERFVPYLGLGAGMLNLDYDLQTQRDGFNFMLAVETGVQMLLTDRFAASGGYRFQHISNARTASPNLGVDTSFVTIGVTYFLP
jgi:lipid A 3-O-deacylase